MKKTVIFLHPHFMKPGGASKVVLEFASRLKKSGIDVAIITSKSNPTVTRGYDVKIISLNWITTGSIFFWLLYPIFHVKLWRAIKQFPGSPLFCHSLAIYWGATLKLFNRKVITVSYFHDLGMPYTDSAIEVRGLPTSQRLIANTVLPVFGIINKKIIKKSDYLVSNSETSAQFIRDKYLRKVDLIAYPGVDLDVFKPSSVKEDYIYTLGRLEKIKNIDMIIRSFAQYCKNSDNQELQLKIIGTGIENERLVGLAETLKIRKRVVFMGNCNQKEVALIASHAKAGIFLCPNESFGLAVVESMACGTPVIGVNHGGIAETVIDGQTGFISELNEKKIADKINNLLSDKQRLKRLSENARSYAKGNYSWNKSVKLLHQFFIRL